MSREFDILYNQVNSNQSPGLDEYEKSVFLTKGQDDIVKAYFDPRGNKFLEGFDNGQKRQYDFSKLIKNETLDAVLSTIERYDPRSIAYLMPADMFLILNESIVEEIDGSRYIYQILPISYIQYQTLMQKPYQYPTKRTVWRLINGQIDVDDEHGTWCEIIGRFKSDVDDTSNIEYRMRYVKKPTPIILVNLKDVYTGLSIDGYYGDADTEDIAIDDPVKGSGIPCYLPEGIHREIVQRAVELATATYNPQALGNIVGVGNVSATDKGIVSRLESK